MRTEESLITSFSRTPLKEQIHASLAKRGQWNRQKEVCLSFLKLSYVVRDRSPQELSQIVPDTGGKE